MKHSTGNPQRIRTMTFYWGRLLFKKGKPMGKGNNRRSNKEVKKPKKVKKKPSATAYSNAEKKPFAAIGKKGK